MSGLVAVLLLTLILAVLFPKPTGAKVVVIVQFALMAREAGQVLTWL